MSSRESQVKPLAAVVVAIAVASNGNGNSSTSSSGNMTRNPLLRMKKVACYLLCTWLHYTSARKLKIYYEGSSKHDAFLSR
jgi:hypothetical protein